MSFKAFAIAGVLALASFAAARAEVAPPLCGVQIPATFDDDGVYVAVSVNGHKDRMVLDTGASDMALGQNEAAAFGIATPKRVEMHGVGGSMTDGIGTATDVSIGPIHLANVPTSVHAEPVFEQDLLGSALLSRYVVTIDFPRKTVTACDPRAFDPSKMTVPAQAVDVRGGLALMTVGFGDQYGQLLLDTGAVRSMLFGEFAKKLPLKRFIGDSYMQGVSVESFQVYRFDHMALGQFDYRDFAIWTQTRPEPASKQYDGLLGRDLMQALRITFDYPAGAVFMERS